MARFNSKDIEALKQLDVLEIYCKKMLGPEHRYGGTFLYCCPWGDHRRNKLEIREWNGKGTCKCWACDQQGDIIDLAAARLGLDAKIDFRDIAIHIAQETGLPLRDEYGRCIVEEDPSRAWEYSSKKKLVRCPKAKKQKQMSEKEALQAVMNAAANPYALNYYAEMLNLPLESLVSHTKLENADKGLLGLSSDDHLLYIYTIRDVCGNLRIQAVKKRGRLSENIRFCWIRTQSPQCLFGILSAEKSKMVIISEGESDALAIRASLAAWLEYMAFEAPDMVDELENMFAVVAKPSADISGVEWALPLRGKDVILCVDNDGAGRKGAVRTIEILKDAGVGKIYVWLPPEGMKDARCAYSESQPDELMNDIIRNKQKLETLTNGTIL